MIKRLALALSFGSLVLAQPAPANIVPQGAETRVSPRVVDVSSAPALAVDMTYPLAAWAQMGTEPGGSAIIGASMFYPPELGPDVVLDGAAVGTQSRPAVATLDHRYLVVWQSDGQEADGSGIFGRVVERMQPLARPELHLNSTLVGEQAAPDVARTAGGEFVVVWQGMGQGAGDAQPTPGIWARVLGTDGEPQTVERPVHEVVAGRQENAAVAPTRDGFVVAWQRSGTGGRDGLVVRRFDADARPLGFEVKVPGTGVADSHPVVSDDGTGVVTLAWEHDSDPGAGADVDVRARRLDRDGQALTTTTVVAGGPGFQGEPDLFSGAYEGFVVGWSDRPSGRVLLRQFDAKGRPGSGVIPGSVHGDLSRAPAIGYTDYGTLRLAWLREGGPAGNGIYSRLFQLSRPAFHPPEEDSRGGPPTAAVKLGRLGRLPVRRGGAVKLRLVCPRQQQPSCDVRVSGSSTRKVGSRPARHGQPRPSRRLLDLGTHDWEIREGHARTVRFWLSRSAVRYLRGHRVLRARFELVTFVPGTDYVSHRAARLVWPARSGAR